MNHTSEIASPKKILIVRLGAMGDIIHALPGAMILRGSLSESKIGWIVEKRWTELLRWRSGEIRLPDIVHEVDTRTWRKNLGSPAMWREISRAIRAVRAEKYDLVVDFQGAMKSAILAQLSGATKRYGFAEAWEKPASLFYTHPIHVEQRHVVNRNVALAVQVAKKEFNDFQGGFYKLGPENDDLQLWAARKLRQLDLAGQFAILNPGAGWGAKQWPADRYAEVARALGQLGMRSLINYGPGEQALAQEVESKSEGHAIAASFTISELIAITQRASLFIGGDTGPMHLAALMHVPVVAIFGPTDPARNGPYGTDNIVLRDPASITSHKRNRDPEAGLLNITTDQVLKAARQLLSNQTEGVRT